MWSCIQYTIGYVTMIFRPLFFFFELGYNDDVDIMGNHEIFLSILFFVFKYNIIRNAMTFFSEFFFEFVKSMVPLRFQMKLHTEILWYSNTYIK